MSVCGTYQHSKVHAGLQAPSASQAPAVHFKVLARILASQHPSILALLTSLLTLNYLQLRSFPSPTTHSPYNTAISARLFVCFCFGPFSLLLSLFPPSTLPLSLPFFLYSGLFQIPLIAHKNLPLTHFIKWSCCQLIHLVPTSGRITNGSFSKGLGLF